MTYDANKKQNAPSQSGGRSVQQDVQQSGQQHGTADDKSRKRPSRGGTEGEQDREKQDQGGQRRAS